MARIVSHVGAVASQIAHLARKTLGDPALIVGRLFERHRGRDARQLEPALKSQLPDEIRSHVKGPDF